MSEKAVNIARELADELHNSDCCEKFRYYKSIVDNDTMLLNKIKEFKKAQFNFRSGVIKNVLPSFEEEKNVSKLYSQLSLNEYARNYLESEKAVLELFNNVFGVISDACEIDLEF